MSESQINPVTRISVSQKANYLDFQPISQVQTRHKIPNALRNRRSKKEKKHNDPVKCVTSLTKSTPKNIRYKVLAKVYIYNPIYTMNRNKCLSPLSLYCCKQTYMLEWFFMYDHSICIVTTCESHDVMRYIRKT